MKKDQNIHFTPGWKLSVLFRHIFKTQIHIQTQIRKTFILVLATNDFF